MEEILFEYDNESFLGVENNETVSFYPADISDYRVLYDNDGQLEETLNSNARTLTGDVVGGLVGDTAGGVVGDVVGDIVDGLVDGSLSGSVSCSGTTTTANTNVEITENVAYSVAVYDDSLVPVTSDYQNVITGLFGTYQPKTNMTYYYFNDELVKSGQVPVDGLAGLDYNYLTSVYLFGLSLKYVYKFLSGSRG